MLVATLQMQNVNFLNVQDGDEIAQRSDLDLVPNLFFYLCVVGNILNLYDGSNLRFYVNQYGNPTVTSGNPVIASTNSSSSVTTTLFSNSAGQGVLQTNSGHSLILGTGGVEKLRITGNGHVNIGGDYAQTTYKFKVTGTSYFDGTATYTGLVDINGGATIAGVSTFSDNIRIVDSKKLLLGNLAAGDCQFIHDGNDTFIQNKTGDLKIDNNVAGDVGGDIIIQAMNGENSINCVHDAQVELYWNGTKKFETGNTVNINSNHFEITSGQQLRFDNSNNDRSSEILNTGSSGNSTLAFKTNGGTRWTIDSSGHIIPGTAGAVNIGSATAEIGDIYFANSKGLKLGSSQVGDLYNDGTDTYFRNSVSNGQTLIRSGGNIWISDYAGNHRAAFRDNSSVDLYFDIENNATAKLATTATGISVHGEVAASQDYPNFRPTLDLNFAAEKKLDPRITYQRTGPASFTDEFGKVVLVGGNVPRFDYDPTTRECKGLLIEESRTNYVRVSTNLASEWVSGSGSFAVDNSITNPDGSVGAYYHTGVELYHQNIDLSGVSTNVITVSLWVKERSGQSGNLDIQIYQQITGSVIDLGAFSFNPATAVISTTDANFSNGTVEEYPNGWYRISAKVTTSSGNFSSSTRFDMQGAEHYVWGMQLEVGAFPTSFIPTYGAIATRGVDITLIDGEEFSEFYNDDEWTMVTHTNVDNSQSLVASPATANSINFEGDDNTKKFQTRYVTSSTVNQGYVDVVGNMSGTPYYDLTGGGVGNYNMKTAHAAKVNDVAASHNGGTVQTDTSVTMLTGGSIMNIGQNPKQFHIKRIMYYPKRLPNTQLVTLSS